jgi:hypothetical protein
MRTVSEHFTCLTSSSPSLSLVVLLLLLLFVVTNVYPLSLPGSCLLSTCFLSVDSLAATRRRHVYEDKRIVRTSPLLPCTLLLSVCLSVCLSLSLSHQKGPMRGFKVWLIGRCKVFNRPRPLRYPWCERWIRCTLRQSEEG